MYSGIAYMLKLGQGRQRVHVFQEKIDKKKYTRKKIFVFFLTKHAGNGHGDTSSNLGPS